MHSATTFPLLSTLGLALSCSLAAAQTQKVSPPEAQAWVDLATYSGLGIPGMGGMGGPGGPGGADPMAMMGQLFGKSTGSGGNRFGNTSTGTAGRWMDVTLSHRRQPLAEALMAVPQRSGLAPTLKLVAPRNAPATKGDEDPDTPAVPPQERPRGKISLYWGCGDTVRAGQPRTVDFSKAPPADMAQIFAGRHATQRGAHSAAGRPLWPSEPDSRMVPDSASLAGEMGFTAAGLPEDFRFTLPAQQDLMPAVALRQVQAAGSTRLSWAALPTARGYFVAAMGSKPGSSADEMNMVLWTSSELPDSGFGLVDYQTNGAVDRWLQEKVLLPASATTCTVPKGVFDHQGAMLRFIAYGSELNLAHPPRPTDPRQPWEPQWAVKVRVKSVAMAMLGQDMGQDTGQKMGKDMGDQPAAKPTAAKEDEPPPAKKESTLDKLRGILGR